MNSTFGDLGVPATGLNRRKVIAFRQRRGSALGAVAEAAPTTSTAADILKQFTPIAKDLISSSATEDVETLKAKIKNHETLAKKAPEPLKTLYTNKVAVLRAKLNAALKAQKEETSSTTSKNEWSKLGKTGGVVAITVGGALILALLSVAGYFARSGRRVSS